MGYELSEVEKRFVEAASKGVAFDFEQETIRAETIRDLIVRGASTDFAVQPRINITRAVIIGHLDLSLLRSSGSSNGSLPPLVFQDCSIRDGLNFSGTKFSLLKLEGCNCLGVVDLIEIETDTSLKLAGNNFRTTVDLSRASIGGSLDLSLSSFGGALKMSAMSIKFDLDCYKAELPHTLDLGRSSIGGSVSFYPANPLYVLDMSRCMIGDDLEVMQPNEVFNSAERGEAPTIFIEQILLRNTNVKGDIRISGLGLTSLMAPGMTVGSSFIVRDIDFTGPDSGIYLRRVNVAGTLIIERFRNRPDKISLEGARLSSLVHSKDTWPAEGGLEINGATYSNLVLLQGSSPTNWNRSWTVLGWLSLQNKKWELREGTASSYDFAEQYFRGQGEPRLADDIYLGKRRRIRRASNSTVIRFGDLVLDQGFGYGLKPVRATATAFVLIIMLALVLCGGIYTKRVVLKSTTGEVATTVPFIEAVSGQFEHKVSITAQPGDSPAGTFTDLKATSIDLNKPVLTSCREFNALYYVVDTFFPVIDLDQEKTCHLEFKSSDASYIGMLARGFLYLMFSILSYIWVSAAIRDLKR